MAEGSMSINLFVEALTGRGVDLSKLSQQVDVGDAGSEQGKKAAQQISKNFLNAYEKTLNSETQDIIAITTNQIKNVIADLKLPELNEFTFGKFDDEKLKQYKLHYAGELDGVFEDVVSKIQTGRAKIEEELNKSNVPEDIKKQIYKSISDTIANDTTITLDLSVDTKGFEGTLKNAKTMIGKSVTEYLQNSLQSNAKSLVSMRNGNNKIITITNEINNLRAKSKQDGLTDEESKVLSQLVIDRNNAEKTYYNNLNKLRNISDNLKEMGVTNTKFSIDEKEYTNFDDWLLSEKTRINKYKAYGKIDNGIEDTTQTTYVDKKYVQLEGKFNELHSRFQTLETRYNTLQKVDGILGGSSVAGKDVIQGVSNSAQEAINTVLQLEKEGKTATEEYRQALITAQENLNSLISLQKALPDYKSSTRQKYTGISGDSTKVEKAKALEIINDKISIYNQQDINSDKKIETDMDSSVEKMVEVFQATSDSLSKTSKNIEVNGEALTSEFNKMVSEMKETTGIGILKDVKALETASSKEISHFIGNLAKDFDTISEPSASASEEEKMNYNRAKYLVEGQILKAYDILKNRNSRINTLEKAKKLNPLTPDEKKELNLLNKLGKYEMKNITSATSKLGQSSLGRELYGSISPLRKNYNELGSQIPEVVKARSGAYTDAINGQEMQKLADELSQAKAALEKSSEQIEGLKQALEEAQKKQGDVSQETVDDIKAQLDEAIASKKGAEEKLIAADEQLKALQNSNTELTNKNTQLQNDLTQAEKQAKEYQGDVSEETHKQTESERDEAVKNVESLKSQVTEEQNAKSQLESELATAQKTNAELSVKLTEITASVNNLKQIVTGNVSNNNGKKANNTNQNVESNTKQNVSTESNSVLDTLQNEIKILNELNNLHSSRMEKITAETDLIKAQADTYTSMLKSVRQIVPVQKQIISGKEVDDNDPDILTTKAYNQIKQSYSKLSKTSTTFKKEIDKINSELKSVNPNSVLYGVLNEQKTRMENGAAEIELMRQKPAKNTNSKIFTETVSIPDSENVKTYTDKAQVYLATVENDIKNAQVQAEKIITESKIAIQAGKDNAKAINDANNAIVNQRVKDIKSVISNVTKTRDTLITKKATVQEAASGDLNNPDYTKQITNIDNAVAGASNVIQELENLQARVLNLAEDGVPLDMESIIVTNVNNDFNTVITSANKWIDTSKNVRTENEAFIKSQNKAFTANVKGIQSNLNSVPDANKKLLEYNQKLQIEREKAFKTYQSSGDETGYQNMLKQIQATEDIISDAFNKLKQQEEVYKQALVDTNSISAEELANLAKSPTIIQEVEVAYKKVSEAVNKYKQNVSGIISEDKVNRNFEKLAVDMQKFAEKNSKFLSNQNFARQYQELLSAVNKSDRNPVALTDLQKRFESLRNEIIATKNTGYSFKDTIGFLFEKIGGKAIIGNLVGSAQQAMRQVVTNVKEIDAAMTELKKVSSATQQTYNQFLDTAGTKAAKLGSTMTELINSTADFARLGFNVNEATSLAENAVMYANVGDIDIRTATDDLVSTLKAYHVATSDTISIVDKFNEVGNSYALSSADIGQGLRESASALNLAGNSLDESIAMITGITEITQSASEAGSALKILSLRLRGAKADLEKMGEDTDGMVTSTSKMRKNILAISGVDIMENDTTFKSTFKIMKEISAIWNDLSDINKANLIESMAGKNRSNQIAALLSNFSQVEASLETSLNSAGSAAKENEKYIESINGKIAQLKATFQDFSTTALESDVVKVPIEFVTGLVEFLKNTMVDVDNVQKPVTDNIKLIGEAFEGIPKLIQATVKALKLLPPVLGVVSAAASAKGKNGKLNCPLLQSFDNYCFYHFNEVNAQTKKLLESTNNLNQSGIRNDKRNGEEIQKKLRLTSSQKLKGSITIYYIVMHNVSSASKPLS